MIRALFGGSFDPVHNGHLAVVDHLLARGLAEAVVVVPAAMSPFKSADAAAAGERLAMTRLAFADRLAVTVADDEILRGAPSYTIDTLRSLAARCRGDAWRLVIGADNVQGFGRWREADELLRLAELVIMPRGGVAAAPPPGVDPGRCLLVRDFDEPVSSSAIRAMLGRGTVPDADLPPAVARHIRARALYGLGRP